VVKSLLHVQACTCTILFCMEVCLSSCPGMVSHNVSIMVVTGMSCMVIKLHDCFCYACRRNVLCDFVLHSSVNLAARQDSGWSSLHFYNAKAECMLH
jgi:hypothetical protein